MNEKSLHEKDVLNHIDLLDNAIAHIKEAKRQIENHHYIAEGFEVDNAITALKRVNEL